MPSSCATRAAALLLLAVSSPCRAAAQAESYTITADAWSCQGRGALMDRVKPETAQCLPMLKAGPVDVLAFQGPYAFICEKLDDARGRSYACSYVLTRDLRDRAGRTVPPHVSKTSPSPHFFDAD